MDYCQNLRLLAPERYYREYTNDFPMAETLSGEQCQKIVALALSFITLDSSFRAPVSLSLAGIRSLSNVYTLVTNWKENDDKQTKAYKLLPTTLAVMGLAGNIIGYPVGLTISAGQDLLIEVSKLRQHIAKGDRSEALISGVKILNNVLYLATFFHPTFEAGGLALSLASLGLQTLLHVYHAGEELMTGIHPEFALAHLALVAHIVLTRIERYQTKLEVNISLPNDSNTKALISEIYLLKQKFNLSTEIEVNTSVPSENILRVSRSNV